MLGLILAAQSAVLVIVHVGLLGGARALAERLSGDHARWATGARLVALLGLVFVFTCSLTGHRFLLAQLAVYVALTCATAIRPREGRTQVLLIHLALFALLLRFLFWRGLCDSRGPTPVLGYVFEDFAAQLLLPIVGATHEMLFGAVDAPFLAWMRISVSQAAQGVASQIMLLGAITTHAVAVVTVRAVTSRHAPCSLSEIAPEAGGVRSAISLLAAASFLPSVSPLLRTCVLGAIEPLLVFEALAFMAAQSTRLRSGRFFLLMLLATMPFAPALLHVLAALGALFASFAGARDDTLAVTTRAPLRVWTASGLVAVGVFGLIATSSGRLLSPARALPAPERMCRSVTFERQVDHVLVASDGAVGTFSVDVEERALEAMSVADAERVCAAEHKTLCTSEQLYVVCACDHAQDGYGLGFFPAPRDGLVARAQCHASNHADGQRPLCETESGVRDLLGGRSEITGTTVGHGAHLVAGANDWLRENWMIHCRWRGVMTDEALAVSAHPMLGFRCCASAP